MEQLSSQIEKIFYINLDRREDRKSHMCNEFKKHNFQEDKIERFVGIDGLEIQNFSVTENEWNYFKNSDFNRHHNKNSLIGNQLSHCRILEQIIKEDIKLSLIFQDDVKLLDNFNYELNKIVDNMPDNTEVIWFGFHKYAVRATFVAWDLINQNKETNNHYDTSVNSEVGVCKRAYNPCSTAYLITLDGAKNFMKHIYENGCKQATDINFNNYLFEKNIQYCSKLVLCTGCNFGSDVFYKNNNVVSPTTTKRLPDRYRIFNERRLKRNQEKNKILNN